MANVQEYQAKGFDQRMLELCARGAPCLLSEFVSIAIHTGIQGANLIGALKQLLDLEFITIDVHGRMVLTAKGLAASEIVLSEGPPALSKDRAPEPTMEDILAEIRRVIAEEETRTKQQWRSAYAEEEDVWDFHLWDGQADDLIVQDIAGVLSGGAPCPGQDSAEEEILDLTAELGGLGPEALPHQVEAAPSPLSELPKQMPLRPSSTQMPQRKLSANEEAAAALERAIAALRAGQRP
jgi:hypothetical protein